ncbi:MAG: hypothetical protein A3A80_01970 [Candidatus Terrybacteria bacterium RIFCSPLOWO2_01_FULL_44_24]|uniref:Uncharacterized protein n=1 Tax=Candidatus Terrybacteria bacterium RIFCSPHIGHO2_01_FULL_43_35 TaxID=1802361 RepID=A0A1G2PEA2_9BACT|nr:MAG: hypothetical protein A2828_01760 [Candidatus Terrybacteria bacterium RIFCSPHIGHO2_01_FULL_43_35]OHA50850.1 MAG: hypothetical protein A3A80_01970 [Candidatus Terrybacteria bacterium RIFCSPLOWO2_01_FULL_44_24]
MSSEGHTKKNQVKADPNSFLRSRKLTYIRKVARQKGFAYNHGSSNQAPTVSVAVVRDREMADLATRETRISGGSGAWHAKLERVRLALL